MAGQLSMGMAPGVAVLADDLTGACDASAPFAALGFRTRISLTKAAAAAAVHAYDMDCRDRTQGVRRAAYEFASIVADRAILLKIDSTLRGPIADLVDGVVDGCGRRLVLVAPALPEQRRALAGGRLLVNGMVDSEAPILAEVLLSVLSRVIATAPGGDGGIGQFPTPTADEGSLGVVIDAGDPEALASVARAWLDNPTGAVLVGSSGVARAAAKMLPPPSRQRRARRIPPGPIAVIAGSPAAATQRQLDRIQHDQADERQLVVFRTPPCAPGTARDSGESVEHMVDQFLAWIEDGHRPSLVVLVGGRAARGACVGLGATGLVLGGELSPGVAYGRLMDGALQDLPVVTKAGAFGNDDLLLETVRAVREPGRLLWNEQTQETS